MRCAALALLACLGCRPPLGRLADARHYDQAVCATRFHSRDPEADSTALRRRIDLDARPRLHLHAIERTELEAAYSRR